jgi:hypothetical protein
MHKINSNLFNFSFFLSDRKKVNSLQAGAIANGGATQYNNGIYSNISGTEYIKVNDSKNTLSVFIPSTIAVNQKADNSTIINHSMKYLKQYYNNDNIIYYNTSGSWYSEDLQKVVIEDITIVSVDMSRVTETDITIFKNLAEYIKREMQQEGVSISINSALAIV